jgi:FAD/FMN-containing dehydrogenase
LVKTHAWADTARLAFADRAILPGDPDYDDARTTFNATIDRRPAAIVRPSSTADVVAAVRLARDSGLTIAVRGGGHSVAGHATADGALVIDLRLLREVVVDPVRRRASVGGGALWNDVDAATTAHGLAMPGGTFGDTGVGGLALGGGFGFLMGTGGLTCDNLVGAEVVTADGSIVVGGDHGDPDLLWALRGGGGNFGVVTRFEFSLRPIGPLYAGYLTVPLEAAPLALRTLDEFAHEAPPELTLFAGGPSARDHEPPAGTNRAAREGLSITVAYQGTADAAEVVIRPLRALPLLHDGLATMNYLDVQAMSGQLPFGLRHYWKGQFLRGLEATAIDAITGAMERAPGANTFILTEAITGAARREPPAGAAFGQREARWNVSGIAVWEDPAEDATQIAWARDLVDSLRPASLTGAGYANYAPVDETPERIRAAFGRERFERLAMVKRRYDPDNVFCFNLNIPPAGDTAG